jgi:thymidylate kinase
MRPPGLVIAVLGTDGAGKSTLISAITPTLSAATHGAFVVKHLRPGLLPPLAHLKGGAAQHEGPVTNPHASKPSGTPGSLFRVVYLMADYVLGYWLAVRPKIAKSPAIVLFDRYAYDMALDPRRFRIGLPAWLVSWFTRFAPRPDIILCLNGDPDIIAARKRELPREEVKRQTEALRVFASHEPRAVLVSTDGTVEQARDSILAALWECCARRTKGCLQRGA